MNKYRKKLEERAEALKIPSYKLLTNEELNQQIKDRSGQVVKAEPAVIEGKAVEVKTADNKPAPLVSSAPSISSQYYGQPITVNVPIPAVNLHNRPAPAWWEIAAEIKSACLYMVAGAASYALVLNYLK